MRLILSVGCILVLTVLACGCIQSNPASPVTPAETSVAVVVSPVAETTVTPHPRMVVNVSAEQTSDSVIVRVDGGSDAKSLSTLNIRITNRDGTTIQRTIQSPVVGNPYAIQVPTGLPMRRMPMLSGPFPTVTSRPC